MFEKEIQFISDFTLNKIKKLGPFFTFEKLFNSDIHPAIIQYISAELDYLIYEDRKKLLTNSVFDYSGGNIARYFLAIGQEIKKSKKVSYEDVKNLVVQAVSFNINFTARPKWSVSRLAFDNAEYRTVEEMTLLLNYIYYYDYIRSIVKAYIQKKNLVNVSAQEFNLVLNKLDKEIFAERPHELIDNALFAMADFASIGAVNKKNVNISSVELFLKEKNLIDYLFKLRKAMPQEAKQKYNIDDIRKVIYAAGKDTQQILPSSADNEEIPVEEELPEKDELIVEPETGSEAFDSEELEELDDTGSMDDFAVDEEETSLEEELTDEDEELPDEEEELVLDYPDEQNTSEEEELDDMFEELKESYSDEDEESEEEKEDFVSLYEKELDALEEEKAEDDVQEEIDFDLPEDEKDDSLFGFDEDSETFGPRSVVDDEEPVPAFKRIEEEKEAKDDGHDFNFEELEEDDTPDTADFAARKNERVRSKDIFNYLSDREIEKIIENIFNEDRDDFATTMEKISECAGYNEATEILKGVFLTYRINPYSRDAVTLTNAVSNYFEQN